MIYVLDRNEKTVAILSNNGSNSCPYYDDVLKENLSTGTSSYEFKIPSNHSVANLVVEGGYIIRTDLDNNLIMFTIMEIQETHADVSEKYIYTENTGLELINDVFRPNSYDSKSADQMLAILLADTRWQMGNVDYFPVDSFSFTDYMTVLSAIQTLATQVGGELMFRVERKNGEISGRYVDLLIQRGNDTKKRFTYTKDITSIQRTIDMSSVVTALIGVGKGDSTSNFTTFQSVSYSIANGDPYDKPLDQDWVGDPDALQQWGTQGKHIFGTFTYDTTEPETLLKQTWEQLQIQKNPVITYDLNVALLERLADLEFEKVRLGDNVYIIDETFSPALYLEARVMQLQTSFTDPSQDKCTLGNFKVAKSNITAQMLAVQNTLFRKEGTWDDLKYNVELSSSNGNIFKNGDISSIILCTVYKGNTDITSTLPTTAFTWKKFDYKGNQDTTWKPTYNNGLHYSITISKNDINEKSTFTCDVDIQE